MYIYNVDTDGSKCIGRARSNAWLTKDSMSVIGQCNIKRRMFVLELRECYQKYRTLGWYPIPSLVT